MEKSKIVQKDQDSIEIMEDVYSEEDEKKQEETALEMNEECKEFIESVKQIKTLTLVERPWWFFYIFFWGGLTILDSIMLQPYFNSPQEFSLIPTIIFWIFLVLWVFTTVLFSFRIYRLLNKPNIYQMCKSGGKNIYLMFVNKIFIYWDGENTARFYGKKAKRFGNAAFKREIGFETLESIVSCNKMKKKERGEKIMYKGENVIYSADARVITEKNNIPKKYTAILGVADGTIDIPKRIVVVNDINRKIYVPKQLKPWLKKRGMEFPDIPNMVEIPDELIWKHIRVRDLYK